MATKKDKIVTGSEATWRKLKRDHDRLSRQVQNLKTRLDMQHADVPGALWFLTKAAADIDADGNGNFNPVRLANGSEVRGAGTVKAYDLLGGGFSQDDLITLWRNPQSQRLFGFPLIGLYLGKTDGSISKGGTGTVSIWSGSAGAEADTGRNLTSVSSPFAAMGATKWCLVLTLSRQKYIITGECP